MEWQRVTTSDTSSDEWQQVVHQVTSDNEWYNKWQRMTTSDTEWQRLVQRVTTNNNEWQRVVQRKTTSDIEWQRVIQRVTTNENELQRVIISAKFSFFQIREEPTTKHPNENSLTLNRTFEERDKPLRRNINSKKEELQKQLFADFHQNKCSWKFFNIYRKTSGVSF